MKNRLFDKIYTQTEILEILAKNLLAKRTRERKIIGNFCKGLMLLNVDGNWKW